MTSTFSTEDLEVLRNRTFDEIVVGDRATIQRTLTAADLQLFAAMSGDIAPAQSDAEPAASTRFHGVIAHGMWGAALISAVLGTRLPGPGTSYAGQTLTFHAPVRVGDTLTVTVTVRFREEATRRLMLDCDCTNQDGVTVISGEATVIAPAERIERPRGTLPQVRISLAAWRRPRAPASVRAPARAHEDGGGLPVRCSQPFGCARRPCRGAHRAGADRSALTPAGARGAVGRKV